MSREVLTPFGSLHVTAKDNDDFSYIITNTKYSQLLLENEYHICVAEPLVKQTTYRNAMFARGIYLNHHTGAPADLYYSTERVNFQLREPYNNAENLNDKIFWGYALKLYLTFRAVQTQALHLKGALVKSPANRLYLLLGRGGSGKSTLSKALNKKGYQVLSNTHCIYKDHYIWGVNTWIRTRENKSEHMIEATDHNTISNGALSGCYILNEYNKNNFEINNIDQNSAVSWVLHFGNAIGNYDLKEDIIDIDPSNFNQFDLLSQQLELTFNFCKENSIQQLTLDAYDDRSLDLFIKIAY